LKTFALILVVLVAVLGRGWSLVRWSPVMRGPEPDVIRSLVSEHGGQAHDMLASPLADAIGLLRVEYWVFDPSAAVLISPGDDGEPGKAGYDDDADGIVDNRSELGAMYSDDVCLAPGDDGYEQALTDTRVEVVSRGAFVPLDLATADVSVDVDPTWRIKLFGVLDGQSWEQWAIPEP